jgi:hypothetical protein
MEQRIAEAGDVWSDLHRRGRSLRGPAKRLERLGKRVLPNTRSAPL